TTAPIRPTTSKSGLRITSPVSTRSSTGRSSWCCRRSAATSRWWRRLGRPVPTGRCRRCRRGGSVGGMGDAKAAAQKSVSEAEGALVELSHTVHAHPELCFEEERSSAWAADALAGGGFNVQAGVADLPTAFVATAGSGPLTLGICAEFDALPAIGHP